MIGLAMAVAACSTAGDEPSTTTATEASTTTTTTTPSVEAAEDAAEAFLSLVSGGNVDEAAALWSESWSQVGIPMTEGDTAVRRPDDPVTGLEFIAAWMDFDAQECFGEQSSATVDVRCLVTVSGAYQEALGVDPFPLPIVVSVTGEGIVSFGTDYNAISSGSFEETDESRRYSQTLVEFYRYAFDDEEFRTDHSQAIGRPVISHESALAHIALAQQWTNEGQP